MMGNIMFLGDKNFRSRSKQKGIALIFFAFLLGLVVTGLGVKLLSGTNAVVQQSTVTSRALAEAKATVIANVTSGQSGTGVGQFPCSENVTLIDSPTEGSALGNCSNSTTSFGRFAWRTLGMGQLTDGNNDKLWYVLSAGFRNSPVNSDTIAGLSINGVQNEAIALLFSPGAVLSTQIRPLPTSSSAPVVTGYLDGENSDGDADFITEAASSTFNDKLVAIKPDDLYPVLEKRALGEFKNYLNAYKNIWGAFPFPAAFGNPTSASTTYVGDNSLSGGFLPVSNTNPSTMWNTSIIPSPVITAPAGNTVSAPACEFRSTNTQIRCEITTSTYNALNPPTVSISGMVNGIGLRFYDGLSVTSTSDIRVTTRSGSATVTGSSVTHNLDSSGNGIVTFTGTLVNTGTVRIEYRRTPPLSNWVLAATNHYLLGGSSGNNWHHLTYYKVADPFLPGGSAACGSCLTVNTINVVSNVPTSNIHALLMSAGRKLNTTNALPPPTYGTSNPAQARPAAILSSYFDSTNNISDGLVFDGTSQPLSTFNDQVKVVE